MRSYKNPPIDEAMCEFTFQGASRPGVWDLTLPGRLAQHPSIASVYDGPAEQQNVNQIFAQLGSEQGAMIGPNLAMSTSLLRVLIPTRDRSAILGVGAGTLSISSLRPYEGWQRFKPRVQTALRAYCEVSGHSLVTRLVLKYVNRLVVATPHAEVLAEYLLDITPELIVSGQGDGPRIRAHTTAYHQRKEFHTEDETRIYVTQATLQPAVPGTVEALLDIEVVKDSELMNIDSAMDVVEHLHSVEGAIFEGLVTDTARRSFDAS